MHTINFCYSNTFNVYNEINIVCPFFLFNMIATIKKAHNFVEFKLHFVKNVTNIFGYGLVRKWEKNYNAIKILMGTTIEFKRFVNKMKKQNKKKSSTFERKILISFSTLGLLKLKIK